LEERDMALEDDIKKNADEAVKKYVASDEFKDVTTAEYKRQIRELIKRSEASARWIAGLSIALVLAVFTALLLLQYADVRNKQADLYERYTAANDLVRKVNDDLGGMQKKVDDATKVLDNFMGDYPARLSALESRLSDTERRLAVIDKGTK
jgi:hypothetical protein